MSGAQLGRVVTSGLLLAVLAGCDVPTAPLPDDAVRFRPDARLYGAWWQEVERCAGRAGRFESVDWFVVAGTETLALDGRRVWGYWTSAANRIVLTEGATAHASVVRHEMLHAILRVEGHPPAYFRQRCAGIV